MYYRNLTFSVLLDSRAALVNDALEKSANVATEVADLIRICVRGNFPGHLWDRGGQSTYEEESY